MAVSAAAGLMLAAEPVLIETPVEIARHKQVQPAVVVVIEEARARAPAPGCHAGPRGGIGESAIAVVAVERVSAISGDVQVSEPVIVETAGGDTHSVAILRHPGQARLFRYVSE